MKRRLVFLVFLIHCIKLRIRCTILISFLFFRWLYKEATVESTDVAPDDSESLIVTAVFTPAKWAKFQSLFARGKKKSKKH